MICNNNFDKILFMKHRFKVATLLMLVGITSCQSKSYNLNTFDLRHDFGTIKLKSEDKTSETQVEAQKIIDSFKKLFSYKAKFIQYYHVYGSKEEPLSCLETDITFSSTSYYMSTVQTRQIAGGKELATPIQTYIYSSGAKTYTKSGSNGEWKIADDSSSKAHKLRARPNIISYSIESANLRSGNTRGLFMFEQSVISQNQITRVLTKDNKIKYYYERMIKNDYFVAYEFTHPEDGTEFRIEIPSNLPK